MRVGLGGIKTNNNKKETIIDAMFQLASMKVVNYALNHKDKAAKTEITLAFAVAAAKSN